MFIFTLLLKPIRVYLAKHGIPSLMYLDDGICSGTTKENALANRAFMVQTLQKAGFIVSLNKSQGPEKRICFLGLEICSESLSFYIPEKKLLKILHEVENLLSSRRTKVRDLARVLGLLQSCARALGPVVRLRTRRLYHWIAEKLKVGNYDYFSLLTEIEKEELTFWLLNLRKLNGFFFSPKLSCFETSITICSDSSSSGMFGYQLVDKYKILLRQMFTAEGVNPVLLCENCLL